MNATGGFSARLNGFRPGHPAKMSSRQKKTPSFGLSEPHYMTDVENVSAGPKPPRPGAVSACLKFNSAQLRSAFACLTARMPYPMIYRPRDLAAEIVAENARLHEIVEKSQTLLKNPSPDTFLGRQHYKIIPLPEQE